MDREMIIFLKKVKARARVWVWIRSRIIMQLVDAQIGVQMSRPEAMLRGVYRSFQKASVLCRSC